MSPDAPADTCPPFNMQLDVFVHVDVFMLSNPKWQILFGVQYYSNHTPVCRTADCLVR